MNSKLRLFFLNFLLLLIAGCISNFEQLSLPQLRSAPRATVPAEPKKVALLLPLSGSLAPQGQAVRNGFMATYQQQKTANSPTIVTYDTTQAASALDLYQRAIVEQADFIVGPLDKKSVQMLNASSGLTVTVLALNYLDAPSHGGLYQFGLSPQDEAKQAADRAAKEGRRAALVIVPPGAWGEGIAQAFKQRFMAKGGAIITQVRYANDTAMLSSQLAQALGYQEHRNYDSSGRKKAATISRREDIDSVFLAATPIIARQIRPLLKFYGAIKVPVYATSMVYAGNLDPNVDRDLDGIQFCDIPWVLNNPQILPQVRTQLASQNPAQFQRYLRLYALGADAYQLTQALSKLSNSPGASIAGATGTLYLNDQQQVLRQLQWAQIRDGVPIVLPNY